MHQPKLDRDIRPVSELRANAAELIEQVKNSGRPLVLTQRGHSTLVEELEIRCDVRTAVGQIECGMGISNREAKAELRRRFRG